MIPLRLRILLAPLVLALAGSLGAQTGPTPYPDPKDEAAWPGVGPIRTGAWMNDNRAYFWTQRENDQGAVVFVGDSLIVGWKNIADAFPGLKVAKRGVGGDVSRGTLFRFQEDVADLRPRALVFCVGTNDLSAHGKPEHVVANISTMVEIARRADPALPVVVCTLPPRDAPKAPTQPGALADLNQRLKAFAAGHDHMALVDLFPAMATDSGAPAPDFINPKDGIHLLPAAYETWAGLLRPAFASLGVK